MFIYSSFHAPVPPEVFRPIIFQKDELAAGACFILLTNLQIIGVITLTAIHGVQRCQRTDHWTLRRHVVSQLSANAEYLKTKFLRPVSS